MPSAGDVDDCAPTAAAQCQNVTAPWLRIPNTRAFRLAAGKPDKPGPTGLTMDDVYRGQVTLYPVYDGLLHKLRGWSWDDFADMARQHHPMCCAVISAKLPARLRLGFDGAHALTVVVKGSGRWLMANPLQKAQSRWLEINPGEVKPALLAYGRKATGTAGCWAVAYPTDEQMATTFLGSRLEDAYRQNEELEARIEAAKEALG